VREHEARCTSRPRVLTVRGVPEGKELRIEQILCALQREAEQSRNPERRLRGRLLCRGFRAAIWAVQCRATAEQLETMLRDELYGTESVLQPEVDDDDRQTRWSDPQAGADR